jgi:hypothetical protein
MEQLNLLKEDGQGGQAELIQVLEEQPSVSHSTTIQKRS